MATEEVGIRLALQGHQEAAAGVDQVAESIDEVGHASERAAKKTSRGVMALKKVGSITGRIIKGGVLTATAAGVGAISVALSKGFKRLTGIENATAKLDGLGHSGKSVSRIMDNALASVRGTAFGMDEAATTAAGAVAAGVKPGKDLERTLKLVADAATIGGTSMGEMGSIFNKVATSNKVQADVMNQLSDRGIPIVQLLAKELGVTGEEVLELAKEGEIGFSAFRRAIESGMGGAALESGNTTTGALKNVSAAMGRFGAGLLSGAFPMIKRLARQAIVVIDGLTERLGPLMERMNASLGPKMARNIRGSGNRILDSIDRISGSIGRLVDRYQAGGFKGVMEALQFKGAGKGAGAASSIGASLGTIGTSLEGVDWAAVKEGLGEGVSDTVSVFSVVIGFAADNVDKLAKYLPFLVMAYSAYKIAQSAANVAALANIPIQGVQIASNISLAAANRALATQMAITNGVETKGTASRIVHTVATVAGTAATKVAAGAQRVLNAVMRANPIGLVITAVLLLVGGLVLLYNKSETVRGIIDGLWNNVLKPFGSFLKSVLLGAISGIASGFLDMGIFGIRAFRMLLSAAFATFGGILAAAEKGLGWIPGIGDKISGARAAFQRFGDSTINKLNAVENKLRSTQARVDGLAKDRSATITITTKHVDIGVNRGGPARGERGNGLGVLAPEKKAMGGPVSAGQPYIVGDRGPRHAWELFVPSENGRILPRVPDVPEVGGVDLPAGGMGGPRVIQLVLPDGRLITELVLEEYSDMAARA